MSAFPGDATSPNYPEDYPDNVEKINTIQVENEKRVLLEFTDLAVWVCGGVDTCSCDHVNVTDETGAALMNKTCGYSNRKPKEKLYFKPPVIKSKSNTVRIFFHSDGLYTRNGWSLKWISISAGQNFTISNFLDSFLITLQTICLGPFSEQINKVHHSECSLASLGDPCNIDNTSLSSRSLRRRSSDTRECFYKLGKHQCCGKSSNSPWQSLACLPDSTTRAGLWLPATKTLCKAQDCGTEGKCWRDSCLKKFDHLTQLQPLAIFSIFEGQKLLDEKK